MILDEYMSKLSLKVSFVQVSINLKNMFLFVTDDDPDAFDFSPPTTRNVEIKLPLSGCQRKLYDDYLSSSQSKLDSLDAKSIASVLQTLRKICNHPQLLEVPSSNPLEDSGHTTQPVPEKDSSLSFCRVIDGLRIPYMVSKVWILQFEYLNNLGPIMETWSMFMNI